MLNDGLFHLDPSVVQPAIPAVLFLIEHEKGLVADLGELGTPAGTALDGLIRLDVAHDHDFLTLLTCQQMDCRTLRNREPS